MSAYVFACSSVTENSLAVVVESKVFFFFFKLSCLRDCLVKWRKSRDTICYCCKRVGRVFAKLVAEMQQCLLYKFLILLLRA